MLCGCRRLGSAGEPAVHLLSRLLSFDPSRRCSAEEALAHEYLTAVEAQASGNFEGGCSMHDTACVAASLPGGGGWALMKTAEVGLQ